MCFLVLRVVALVLCLMLSVTFIVWLLNCLLFHSIRLFCVLLVIVIGGASDHGKGTHCRNAWKHARGQVAYMPTTSSRQLYA